MFMFVQYSVIPVAAQRYEELILDFAATVLNSTLSCFRVYFSRGFAEDAFCYVRHSENGTSV